MPLTSPYWINKEYKKPGESEKEGMEAGEAWEWADVCMYSNMPLLLQQAMHGGKPFFWLPEI